MSPTPFSALRRGLTFALVALTLLALAAAPVAAAECPAVVSAAIVPAFDMMDVVHDRTRLVQFSIGAVALGIALLWLGQKT